MRALGRPLLVAVALATVAALGAACTPPPSETRTVSDATLEWTISREADNGAFAPGQVNYWSAGRSDSTEATYVATDGDVTILKKNASGTYVPIGSESAVSWANRNRDGAGNVVTATNSFHLGQKVRISNGTGTVDSATGEATIEWDGTFTVNFYGQYVPFWLSDLKLTVDASGKGTLTATLGGYASDMSDPDVRVALPDTPNVVVAEIPNVWGSGTKETGFTNAPTAYVGTAVEVPAGLVPQLPKDAANSAFWGSWPQSFVDFQQATGLGAYWYTSGGAADPKKVQDPISVAWTLES